MDVLKFTLSGKTAFFKKPDVNSYIYFTYGCIHKVALLGILGAVLGYSGYNQMDAAKDKYPEFYEKLNTIKVSIVPNNEKGFIQKKIQKFNNSVGYASQEAGGNLIVCEQWLENPSWDIYILLDSDESQKIKDSIINRRTVFQPYLGKNDHYADIEGAKVLKCSEVIENEELRINSLVKKTDFKICADTDYDPFDYTVEEITPFKYQEKLPVGLDEETNMYVFGNFIYTNMQLKKISDCSIYSDGNRSIVFY